MPLIAHGYSRSLVNNKTGASYREDLQTFRLSDPDLHSMSLVVILDGKYNLSSWLSLGMLLVESTRFYTWKYN